MRNTVATLTDMKRNGEKITQVTCDDYSRAKVTWNGKELTRYEASQKMRNAETRIRELKDIKAVYKASGDSLNEARYNKYINDATAKYKARCKEAGLKVRIDRL